MMIDSKQDEIKVILTEEIVWKFSRPQDFKCFICREREATMRSTCKFQSRHGGAVVILSVCAGCNTLETIGDFLQR